MSHLSRITMLNVGQGDSFVVELPSKELIVIDSRKCDPEMPPATLSYLQDIWKTNEEMCIDIMCLTHPHLDHFSGLREVMSWCRLKKIPINQFVACCGMDPRSMEKVWKRLAKDGVRPPVSAVFKEYCLLDKEIRDFKSRKKKEGSTGYFKTAVGIQNLSTGDLNGIEYSVDIIGPLSEAVLNNIGKWVSTGIREMTRGACSDPVDSPMNDTSCIIAVTVADTTVLFTGDSSPEIIANAWREYVAEKGLGTQVSVIKMPHHGSRGSEQTWPRSRERWAELLGNGTLALLSYGFKNRYSHPHKDLLEVLRKAAVYTVSTNWCADCSGEELIVNEDEFVSRPTGRIEVDIYSGGRLDVKGGERDGCEYCSSFYSSVTG